MAGALLLLFFPWHSRDVELELLVLGGDGRFAESVRIPRYWTDTAALAGGAVARVPLVLAIRNTGKEPSPPARLELNLPVRYRIARSRGQPLSGRLLPGTPMVRYHLDVPPMAVSGEDASVFLPVLDTLWLEPIIPSFYCIALSDSVPDFVPAPPAPVGAIARVRIFYSFTGEQLKARQTGLLAVQLDSTLLRTEAPTAPPVFPTQYQLPQAIRPVMGALRYAGSRQAFCGDPENPVEILSTLWETPGGGRFFVLDHGGAPRKYLFDMDRDSIIELEIWDPSGDGHFTARRQAKLPIPAFLMPPRLAPPFDVAIFDRIPEDARYRIDRYGRTPRGAYRWQGLPRDTAPRIDRYRPRTTIRDEEGRDRTPGYANPAPAYSPPASFGQPAPGSGAPFQAPQAGPPLPGRPVNPAPGQPPAPAPRPPAGGAPRSVKPQPDAPPRGGRPPRTEPAPTPGAELPKPERAPKPEATTKPGAKPPAEPKLLGRPADVPARPRPDTTGGGE